MVNGQMDPTEQAGQNSSIGAGLPPGYTVKPLNAAAAPGIPGIPAGYTVKPIAPPAPQAPASYNAKPLAPTAGPPPYPPGTPEAAKPFSDADAMRYARPAAAPPAPQPSFTSDMSQVAGAVPGTPSPMQVAKPSAALPSSPPVAAPQPAPPLMAQPPAPEAPSGYTVKPIAAPKVDPQRAYDVGPLAGMAIPGLVAKGNIDVNHRPAVKNDDGTQSSIFSVTVPVNAKGEPQPWDEPGTPKNPAITGYALVPSIVDGKFLTPDGKLPPDVNTPDDKLGPADRAVRQAKLEALEQEATKYYAKTGQHLGIFRTEEAADDYARHTHAYTPDGTAKQVFAPSRDDVGALRAAPEKGIFGKAWDLVRSVPTGTGGSTATIGDVLDRAATEIGGGLKHASADLNEQMLPHAVDALDALDKKLDPVLGKGSFTPEENEQYLVSQGVPADEAKKFRNLSSGYVPDPLRAAIDAYRSADPKEVAKIQDRGLSVANVVRGISAGGRQVADGLSTPQNAALIYALTETTLPRAVKMLTNMGFAAEQAHDAARNFRLGYDAYKKGDALTATQEWTSASADALLFFLTGAHLADARRYEGAYGEKGVRADVGPVRVEAGYRPAYRAPGPEGSYSEAEGSRVVPGSPTFRASLGNVRVGGNGVPAAAPEAAAPAPRELGAGESVPRETESAGEPVKAGETPGAQAPAAAPQVPRIGAVEAETGRPVLQEGETPEEIQKAATEEHPAVKSALAEVVARVPGAMLAGARPEKDTDRLEEKIEKEGQSPQTARDYSGFRIAVDTPQAAVDVANQLKQRFEVHAEQNEFDAGNQETGFHAHTLNVREPGSEVSHEVQILPREVAEAANADHALYEQARDGDKAAQAELKARNERNYAAFQQRASGPKIYDPETGQYIDKGGEAAAEPKYKYGNTQLNIPDGTPAAAALDKFRAAIPDADLAGDGKDVGAGGNHVTVRYGIQGDDTAGIRRYLESQPPFMAHLGPTEVFPPTANSDGAAVLHARIEAPELTRMNAEIEPHGDFAASDFKDYKPHATIAYIKPELAEQYRGRQDLAGAGFPVTSISISDRNGNQVDVPLKGHRTESGGAGAERGGEPKPGEVGSLQTSELHFDPRRFQYKMNVDASGVTNLLKGQRWNPDLAGVISVWRDPADGRWYVVNGHNRAQLAIENHIAKQNVLHIPAETAEEARATAALQNIAEGRGTPVDAAKFFRDTGLTVDDLKEKGISLGEATAANGMALSRLDQSLFDRVVNGQMRLGRAIAIGNATDKPEEQEAILKLIQRRELSGHRVSDDTVDELARMVYSAGEHTDTQQTLFGAVEMRRNLALEKAEISAYIREEIGKEKRLFGTVADEGRAKRLEKGGNVIDAVKNLEMAEQARQDQELYDRLSSRAGAMDDVLSQAAKELADGKKNATEVKRQAYEAARGALRQALAGGQGARAGGGGTLVGSQQAAGPATPAGAAPSRSGGEAAGAAVRPPGAANGHAGDVAGASPARGDVVALTDGTAGVVQHWQPAINGAPARARVRLANGDVRSVGPRELRPVPSPAAKEGQPWIGVDLDGTLARYEGYKGAEVIGSPVPAMVDRVKRMLAEGKNVKIFTARISEDPTGRAKAAIEAWAHQYIGEALPVTDVKDAHMTQMWDDRAVQVERNTGRVVGGPQAAEAAETEQNGKANLEGASGAAATDPALDRNRPGRAAGPERDDLSASERNRGDQRPRPPGANAADFQKELPEAVARQKQHNLLRAQVALENVMGAPALTVNADAYEALRKMITPETEWLGAALEPKVAASWVARMRSAESRLRQMSHTAPGMRAVAEAAKKIALQLDAARTADGALLILRGDWDEATAREELWHLWTFRTQLYAGEALRRVADRPEFDDAIAELRNIGYDKIGADDLAAEALAKAAANDPEWKIVPAVRTSLLAEFLKAAVDEKGAQVLDKLPPVAPEAEAGIEEARSYARQQAEGNGGAAVRGVGGQGGTEARPDRGQPGRAIRAPGQGEHAAGGAGQASEQGGAAQGELDRAQTENAAALFKRLAAARRGAVRAEDSLALPGMEGAVRGQYALERGGGQPEQVFRTREAAEIQAERHAANDPDAGWHVVKLPSLPGENQTVPYLPVTAAMRKSVLEEGQPLFKRAAAPRETTVTTGKYDTGKSLEDAIEDLAKLPKRRMTMAERVEAASDAGVRGIADTSTAIEKSWAAVKGAAVGAWDSWNQPAPWTDYLSSLGDLRKAELKAAMDVDNYQKELKRVAPSEREREAITAYSEARDDRELRGWATLAKAGTATSEKNSALERYAEAFEDALSLTPEQKAVAEAHRRYYAQQLKILTDAGLLPAGASHYAMHMFLTDPETLARLRAATDFAELMTNPSFLNKRVYKSYFEALTHGERPKTMDAGKILSAYHDAFTKTFMTRAFIRSLLYGTAEEDGRPLAALESRAGWTVLDKDPSIGETRILKQPKRPENMDGYVRIPASQLRNFTWELSEADKEMLAPGYERMPAEEQARLFGPEDPRFPVPEGKQLAMKGDVLIHPAYAGRVRDLVTRTCSRTRSSATRTRSCCARRRSSSPTPGARTGRRKRTTCFASATTTTRRRGCRRRSRPVSSASK